MGQRLCKWFWSTAETQEADEPACVFCGRADQDSSILGEIEGHSGFYFHKFCVIFTNDLWEDVEDYSCVYFWIKNRIIKLREAEQTLCFVCGKKGATITCAGMDCDRSFHLPCASEGECVTQYFGEYRSFCMEHCPQQAVEATPAQDTTCVICMDPVGDSVSYSTMVCPACQHAWFHRACIQQYAMSAGCYRFHCPVCRDRRCFVMDMRFMGIQIPVRRPSWEDNDYALVLERHGSCDASVCLCPGGREQAEEEGPWQLLLCSSCAAQGTHRRCSDLSPSTTSWECNGCAGEGTASSTTSQSLSGSDNSSSGPESSSLSSQSRSDRSRIRSREQQDENNERRRRRGSSHNAAPTAGRRTPDAASQETSASSRRRQGQRARTRSRSPLQRRAPDSPSQPQTRRGSRQAPASSAESGTQRYSRQGAAPNSRVSMAAERRQSGQTQRARTRSRSPLEHRAAETNSQPQRRRRSRSRRPGPAQGRSRSRVPRRAQNVNRRPH